MSFRRSDSDSDEKPPKTTVCGAPSRAHASIATAVSGNHAHVDPDRRPLANAELLQPVRETNDVTLEIRERDRAALVLGLALPVVRDLAAVARLDVAVDAVEADVELAAEVPLRVRRLPLVQVRERLEPRDAVAPLGLPELLEVALVDLRLRVGLPCELWIGRVPTLLQEHRVDRVGHGCNSYG